MRTLVCAEGILLLVFLLCSGVAAPRLLGEPAREDGVPREYGAIHCRHTDRESDARGQGLGRAASKQLSAVMPDPASPGPGRAR